ncbi:hypothetical protein BV22DRAFT_1031606 [Leucogyrophana mollusca]|uniref:Uncharacterized protein n=1 Tax=Leucogyrophana mollusca TaxID=85980 RepID=A0ACB8BNS1_9AGAM|nr:hypothetical protein BV22DRAFT_1031606 [Leucogyrophana mollusca]
MPGSLVTTPPELLEQIVLSATRDAQRGPPAALRSILLTCRMSYNALSADANPHLYLMLFVDKFDVSAPRRNIAIDRLALPNLDQELKKRFTALHCFRRGNVDDPQLLEAFATAYVMMLEDDGLNWGQLLWAEFPSFMEKFLRERLLSGAADNDGWPVENEINALAVALFWLISSSATVSNETEELRKEFMDMLCPFAFAGFRYPCFTSPEYEFYPSNQDAAKISVTSVHGVYPPVRPVAIEMVYFGESVLFHIPPIAPYAILAYFARSERRPLAIPPHLPVNRLDAILQGREGPTQDDLIYFNARCKTHFALTPYKDSFDVLMKSRRHDPDWRRSIRNPIYCSPSSPQVLYIPGTLTGSWGGSFIAPYHEAYRAMLTTPVAPSPFPHFGRFPLYVTFRELYCYTPSLPASFAEDAGSFTEAFLPAGCQWREHEAGIEIYNHNTSFKAYYHPPREGHVNQQLVDGVPGGSNSSSYGVSDVIITGVTARPQTETRHAEAWGGYKYIGRIRPTDGLIVLLRVPLDPAMIELGRALFRGYVISSRNFVGRWRHVSNGVQPADWEAIFSLCKDTPLP